MAQQSVVNYFNTRKRGAIEDLKINSARKVLLLEKNDTKIPVRGLVEKSDTINNNLKGDIPLKANLVSELKKINSPSSMARKKLVAVPRSKKTQAVTKMGCIEPFLAKVTKNQVLESETIMESTKIDSKLIKDPVTPTKNVSEPNTPTKRLNAMDKIVLKGTEPSLVELKQKLSRSSRLAELKASLSRFKQSEKQLKAQEEKTKELKESPVLKNFKAIELEVNLSPTKVQSPEKQYLSPKKDTSVRRNLFNLQSPTKNATQMPVATLKEALIPIKKESLALPYKYRMLAEIFRGIDTVSQILHNRKETITYKKLKPAVEEMLKKNISEKRLGQIKFLFPEAFTLKWEKLREFGTGTRRESWELVIIPQEERTMMTSEVLLERRRKLYKILIEKLKTYHEEFLITLDPPMEIPRDKITRWHPLFDIEKIPDVESNLPEPPAEEKFTTGSQVLDKARKMFNCNTRMERALEKLKETQEVVPPPITTEISSVLKGIPKALLEKVRQKQAAKALESMTRSTVKEKEVQLYSRLPEVARLARNLFVSEKKSVLPLELVIDKLCNSYKVFATKNDMEVYLKTIAKEVGEWLVFHEIRGAVFIKLTKSSDLSLVMTKLQNLAEQKKTN